jgi:predicted GNAT family acetyltransferase
MEVKHCGTAKDFLKITGEALAKDEARYGLILGIARRLIANPNSFGASAPWFCTVEGRERVCAMALRTPPYNVLLAHFSGEPTEISRLLVESISEKDAVIPGVVGDKDLAERFVEIWCRQRGVNVKGKMSERLYKLVKINDAPLARGRFRQAKEADAELVKAWTKAFDIDTFGENLKQPETDMTPYIASGDIFLWEDRQPVAMAAKLRPTDNGMSVAYVYTPPEFRRRGYATSCVAGVCHNILQSGYQFCMLYADLANPVSNSIYKKIGFKEVCDSVMYSFTQ